jgi:threonyl-tRNA synthetase
MWRDFGFEDIDVYLSTRPEHAVGDLARWDQATEALRRAVEAEGLPYEVDEGGGAFYGPKIDLNIRDAMGRRWQMTTIQFDFNESERFDITYVGQDGQPHRPYLVHRALLGALERFFGILVEHYGGAFPVWLAPVQVLMIPIADRHTAYARQVAGALRGAGLRVGVDDSDDRMGAKIRNAQLQRVPYMLVVGDREVERGLVSVRLRTEEDLGPQSLDDFTARVLEVVEAKRGI